MFKLISVSGTKVTVERTLRLPAMGKVPAFDFPSRKIVAELVLGIDPKASAAVDIIKKFPKAFITALEKEAGKQIKAFESDRKKVKALVESGKSEKQIGDAIAKADEKLTADYNAFNTITARETAIKTLDTVAGEIGKDARKVAKSARMKWGAEELKDKRVGALLGILGMSTALLAATVATGGAALAVAGLAGIAGALKTGSNGIGLWQRQFGGQRDRIKNVHGVLSEAIKNISELKTDFAKIGAENKAIRSEIAKLSASAKSMGQELQTLETDAKKGGDTKTAGAIAKLKAGVEARRGEIEALEGSLVKTEQLEMHIVRSLQSLKDAEALAGSNISEADNLMGRVERIMKDHNATAKAAEALGKVLA